ncbi:MAG TPA: acyl-CoA dehydrogenase family protein [Acidimicrobiales bacterium]|nr:acyl-CoA dehydrogenase family protein [Acidimicrobiales bacterium]
MITGEDRELFARSLRQAVTSRSGDALDKALDEIGWRDALVDDTRTAVSLLFALQGEANATSRALERVVSACGATDVVVRSGSGLDRAVSLVDVGGPAYAVAVGRLALAHELVGAARAMLELARVHALERVQFGGPIARFQAVRHRLAESLVAIEAASDAADAAWDDGSPLAASVAKAISGRNAGVVARHCQQVLAGVGFTIEHPFHNYLRRVITLDHLLGDSKTLTREIGQQLLTARRLPAMLPL